MASDYTVAVDLEIQNAKEAEESVLTVREQLALLEDELSEGKLKGEAFTKAAKKAGELKKKVDEAALAVDTFSKAAPRLEAFISTVTGVVGGFAAAQGAAALFGGENEKLEETMVKVQGSMAVLMGIQQLSDTLNKRSAFSTIILANAKKILARAIGTSTGALKTFKLALISTGIGAFVVVIGLLVNMFSKMKAKADEASGSLGGMEEQIDRLREQHLEAVKPNGWLAAFVDVLGGTSASIALEVNAMAKGIDEAEDLINKIKEIDTRGLERQKARLEASGEDTFKIQEKILFKKRKLYREGSNDFLNVNNEILVLRLKAEKVANDKLLADQKEADAKKLEQLKASQAKIAEQEQKFMDDQRAWFDEERAKDLDAQEQISELRLQSIANDFDREQAILKDQFEKNLLQIEDSTEGAYELRVLLQQKYNADSKKLDEERAKSEKEIADKAQKDTLDKIEASIVARQNERDALNTIAKGGAQTLINIGALLGQSEEQMEKFRKASTLIQIAQDTASAVSSLMAASEANPANAVTFGFAGIAQFVAGITRITANILQAKQLLSQKSPSAPSAPSAPSISTGSGARGMGGGSTPNLFRQVQNTTTNLPQTPPPSGEQKAIKAYVVETDMRGATNRVDRIKRRATI